MSELLIAGWVLTVFTFVLYLHLHDKTVREERAVLLDRLANPQQRSPEPSDVPLHLDLEDPEATEQWQRERGEVFS